MNKITLRYRVRKQISKQLGNTKQETKNLRLYLEYIASIPFGLGWDSLEEDR